MAIKDIQERYRELGRIRLGKKGAKGEPQKLDTFRLTSPSEDYLKIAAHSLGGSVQPWEDAPTGKQYQLITDTDQLKVLVPEQRMRDGQSYELWTAGGRQRNCDGVTQIDGTICVCEPGDRECKPVTHLQVMLPQLPDLGVWRVTTHGFRAAAELPMTVDLLNALAAAGRHVPVVLRIEHDTSKVEGKTHRYVVPTLGLTQPLDELEAAQGLEAGTLSRIAAGPKRSMTAAAERPSLPEERPALPAEPASIPTPDDSAELPVPTVPTVPPDSSADVSAAEPRVIALTEGSAAEIRTAVMALHPSEALDFARYLLEHQPPTGETMPVHQLWVRRLFYAMERPGLWRPAEEAALFPEDGEPMATDPLHVALWSHKKALHLGDLLRDDLLPFCQQAADAADAKLGEANDG